MASSTEEAKRYALSFTSGDLLVREAVIVAPLCLEKHDVLYPLASRQIAIDLDDRSSHRRRGAAT
jgi:hypothetical protein